MLYSLVLFLLQQDIYHIGCFLGTVYPTKFYTSFEMDPRECRQFCNFTYRYAVIGEGVRCLCFHDLDTMNPLPEALCSTMCPDTSYPCGYSMNMYRFSVYRTTAHLPFPIVEAIENCSLELIGPYQSYFPSSNLVDIDSPFNLNVTCQKGSNIIYNFTFGDGLYSVQETNNSSHIYSTLGEFTISILMINEINHDTLEFVVESVTPGFPIFDITTLPGIYGQICVINVTVASTTDVQCTVHFGDDTSEDLSQVSFKVQHEVQHMYLSPKHYEVEVNCSNLYVNRNVSRIQTVEEEISGLTMNLSWIFEVMDLSKEIHWSIGTGSHVIYNLTVGNSTRLIPANTSTIIDDYLTNIGEYDFTLIALNYISAPTQLNGEIVVQRRISGLVVDHPRYCAIDQVFNVNARISQGSHLFIHVRIRNSQLPTIYEYTILNSTFQFSHSINESGDYMVEVHVWNDVTSIITELSVITIEEKVKSVNIASPSVAQPFNPFQVNVSAELTKLANLHIRSTRTDMNLGDTCYLSYLDTFYFLTSSCVITECGIYNISADIYNNISSTTSWTLIEIKGNVTEVDFIINRTIVAINDQMSISVKAEGDPGIVLVLSWGDGVESTTGFVTPGLWTDYSHTYSIHGDFNVTVIATNQIITQVDSCEHCVSVQEPISDIVFSPRAFQLGSPVLISWNMRFGSHSRGRVSYDFIEVNSSNFVDDNGWMSVSNDYDLSLGKHTVDLILWNDVSSSITFSDTIYILIPVSELSINVKTNYVATNELFNISYIIETGTDINISIHSDQISSNSIASYISHANRTSGSVSVSFSSEGIHEVHMNASNLLGNTSSNEIAITVEDPIQSCRLTAINATSHLTPILITLGLSISSQAQPGLEISSNLGNGMVRGRTDFFQTDSKTFTLAFQYGADGYYNLTTEVFNNVSRCDVQQIVQVGEPIDFVVFGIDKYLEATNEVFTFNLTIKYGTQAVADFDFGDGSNMTLFCPKGTALILTHTYVDPGSYNVSVAIANNFGIVNHRIDQEIITQEEINGFYLHNPSYYQAVNTSVDLKWDVSSGSHITCQLLYNGNVVFNRTYCNTSEPVTLPATQVQTTEMHIITMNVWNLVTALSSQQRTIYVLYQINELDLVSERTSVMVNEIVNINITILEGSGVNLNLYKNSTSIRSKYFSGTANHHHTFSLSFKDIGIYNISAEGTNSLGRSDVFIIITVDMPIVTSNLNVSDAEDVDTLTVFTIVLNQDPNVHYPTLVVFSMDFGDGTSCEKPTLCFGQVDSKTWVGFHKYDADGTFTVNVNSSNGLGWILSNSTFTIGAVLSEFVIECESLAVPTFVKLACEVIIIEGSFGQFDFQFSDGEALVANGSKVIPATIEKEFMLPGQYTLDVRGRTIFNELTISFDKNISVMDSVRGLSIKSDKGAYSEGHDPIMLAWGVSMGQYLSCTITTNVTCLYNNSNCPPVGRINITHDYSIGNHTLDLAVWNEVTAVQKLSLVIRVERPIRNLTLVASKKVVTQNESFVMEAIIESGTGILITIASEGSTNFINEMLFVPVANGQIIFARTFESAIPMVFNLTAEASNVLGIVQICRTIAVQGVIEGLLVTETNVSDAVIPAGIKLHQSPGHLDAVFLTITIDWGDGRNETISEVTITANSPFSYLHTYGKDGIYGVSIGINNDVSQDIQLKSAIQVGEALENLQIEFEKSPVMTNEDVKLCVNFTKGSNITMVLDCQDGRPMTTQVISKAYCLHLTFNQPGFNRIMTNFSNHFSMVVAHPEIFVEEKISGMNMIVPSFLVKGTETSLGVSFYKIGVLYCVLIAVGENDNKFVFGGTHCKDEHLQFAFIESFVNQTKFLVDYTYEDEGKYEVNVTAYNQISRESQTVDVKVTFCKRPVVTIHGHGKNKHRPASFYRSHPIILEAQVKYLDFT